MKKSKPHFKEEKILWDKGYQYVIGIDEVGRGAFAGPVVVAAVVFNRDNPCLGIISGQINDSKLLTAQKREKLDPGIRDYAQFYSIATVGVPVINKVGIGQATSIAFRKVISNILNFISKKEIPKRKVFVLVDGFHVKYIRDVGLKNQKAIIKGDQKSISIAAASIVAKVYRDNLMIELDKKYPQYFFAVNKGYGTKVHREAIKKYGFCKIHRRSFNLSRFTSCRQQYRTKSCL